MSVGTEPFHTPYTPTPGGSTPPAHVGPEEGSKELWSFFWLAVLNTVIIGVVGIVTWWFVTHP